MIAYREGQGEAPATGPDLLAFMAADTRVLPTLVTEITSYADLRGDTLTLDAMTTGYAFALIAMMERGGLKPGEYKLYPLGGALERFKAMQEKRYAGALFNPPFGELLQAQGYNELDTAIGALGHYQGMSGAARAPPGPPRIEGLWSGSFARSCARSRGSTTRPIERRHSTFSAAICLARARMPPKSRIG